MLIKPLRVDNSNKLLNKIFPNGRNLTNASNAKPSNVNQEIQQVEEPKKQLINVEGEDFDSDDYDDTSSVSSCESDQREFNIWDNCELRLRAVDTDSFSDFYGKRLSFLQLYKIRSFFYTKGMNPNLGDIFKDAEKIHKFCRMQLNLDDFLEEEARYNILDVDMQKDKNFNRFSHFFEQTLEFNSQKMRDEFYDRYTCVNFQGVDSAEQLSTSPQKRNSTFVRNGQRMISGLNLSPRKPPAKKKLLTELVQQKNGQEQVRKSQLNLYQLSDMQRKQKMQISQQKFMQDKIAAEHARGAANEDSNKQQLLIADLAVQDNFVSTSDSNNLMSNSSCGSQQDCISKSYNNPTNQIKLTLTGSNGQSPSQSPISNGSFKRSSPNGSQKSPNLHEQNEFRLKLCNTRDFDETQQTSNTFNYNTNNNNGSEQRQISQFSQNNTNTIQAGPKNVSTSKVEGMSSFSKFVNSSQSPKKRIMPKSVNASPSTKTSSKLQYEFNGTMRLSQNNNAFNTTQTKKFANQQMSSQPQPLPLQSEYYTNGKINSVNTSIKELKLPNIGAGLRDQKISIKLSSESPVRNSQLYHQNSLYSQQGSPNLNHSPILNPQSPTPQQGTIIQQSFQRTHKKFQSTVFGEEARKHYHQLLASKQ